MPFTSTVRKAHRLTRSPISDLKPNRPSPRYLQGRKRVLQNLDPQELYEDDCHSDSTSLFHWDDEKTLVADLMHTGMDDETEEDKISSLIYSLEPAFSAKSRQLLTDIADSMVPVVQRVKKAHEVLAADVDKTAKLGLDEFEKSCKPLEAAALKQYDGFVTSYNASQTRLAKLFEQLQDAFQERDKLWNDFEGFLDAQFAPLLATFEQLPKEMEKLIASAEKQKKQLTAHDKGGAEKMLKEVLSRLS